MGWKATVGSLAGKLGLDGDAVVAGAERAAKVAAESAKRVAEQAAPAAKRVATRLQSAGASLVDDVRHGLRDKSNTKLIGARAKAAAQSKSSPVLLLRYMASAPFDTTGLAVSSEDVTELARTPKELYDAVINATYRDEAPSSDVANTVRTYVAATTPEVCALQERLDGQLSAIAERSGLQYGHVKDVWGTLQEAPRVLQRYDAAHDTDFASTAWLEMLARWTPASLPADTAKLDAALNQAIQLAASSRRSHVHAAALFDRLTTLRHEHGWPTSVFKSSNDLKKLFEVAKAAAEQPSSRDATAATVARFCIAVLEAPVLPSEQREGSMHPLLLRADLGIQGAMVLKELGSPVTDRVGELAFALLGRPDARPGEEDMAELSRVPPVLTDPKCTWSPEAIADRSAKLSPSERDAIERWVAGTTDETLAREQRLSAFAATPLSRQMMAAHMRIDNPTDGAPSALFNAVALRKNLERARQLLAARSSV